MPNALSRYEIRVVGVVQGVGFRPFIYRLATTLGLKGTVRNAGSHLLIDVEGDTQKLQAFLERLRTEHPPLAHITELTTNPLPYLGRDEFIIEESAPLSPGEDRIYISPDLALCSDCRHELLDPSNRRYDYPFINCTNCGPRFTIVTGVPYDRSKTTMRDFILCPDCAREYGDPGDRRYHAEPIACSVCGPRVSYIDADGSETSASNSSALSQARESLLSGKILAIKGLGGFHLACNALDTDAVKELRRRKARDEKPFAVMAADLDVVSRFCKLGDIEKALLRSSACPITLIPKRPGCAIPDTVAPGNPDLGVMLPYTPLHVLLFEGGHLELLIMTSGNISGEPICFQDAEAFERLKGIADGYCMHNREIHTRVDDSVVKVRRGQASIIRRSRGYVPSPITVKIKSQASVMAVGGQLKNTFCLNRGNEFYLSHHIGDLENFETLQAFEAGIHLFTQMIAVSPVAVAHDLHPNYLSTQYAQSLALPQIGIQHHKAHIAGCIVDNQLQGGVIGVAFDGTGYGDDGRIWGGEFFAGDLNKLERIGHLEYVTIPGGDSAVVEPWRTACGYLVHSFGHNIEIPGILEEIPLYKRKLVSDMLTSGLNTYETSSAGRFFDAAAALCGIRTTASYEGQAAIELEFAAARVTSHSNAYPIELDRRGTVFTIRTHEVVRGIVADKQLGKDISAIASSFHETVARIIFEGCICSRNTSGYKKVVLSGGVFQNGLLVDRVVALLESAGFTVYCHRQVPANDGGLSLGQAVLALTSLS